jgi:hypothetical protein
MNEPPENTGRKADGTFASGNRANPSGKPNGARHRATLMAEKLFAADTYTFDAPALPRPEPDGALRIVANGERKDGAPISDAKRRHPAGSLTSVLPDAAGGIVSVLIGLCDFTFFLC